MVEPAPAAALEAMSDPHRRAIVELLAAAPSSVQALADRLPISRPAVSRHLRLLKGADLVHDEAVGAQRIYSLRAEGLDAARAYFTSLWSEATARYRLVADNVAPKARP